MLDAQYRCTVTASDGVSRRVERNGLLIGRHHSCDIVVEDPSISRRHALIRSSFDGVELVPLGRTAVLHNGRACERVELLANGDRITAGQLELTVRIEQVTQPRTASYRIMRARSSYPIVHTPFVVGGGDSDDLILERWPPSALRFHVMEDDLYVEVLAADVTKNDEVLEHHELEPVMLGDTLAFQADHFEIGVGESGLGGVTSDANELPTSITIEMLPRGGRVVFGLPQGERAVYLSDRRLDLIVALVRPPAGYAPGDFIPDDALRPIVWPRNQSVSRTEINIHILRCRKDLLAAGIPGPRLLQRARGGGATRLALAPGCKIELG